MAVIKRGILGGFTGSVANVVGSTWKGIDVMRSKPLSVANPRTAAQVAQRDKMTVVVGISKALLVNIIKPLWDRFAQRKSGYNAFVQRNISAVNPDETLDMSIFITSQGTLTATSMNTVDAVNGSATITVGWSDNSGTGTALATDKAYLTAYNETQDVWGSDSDVGVRSDAGGTVDLPAGAETGDTIHVFLSFRRADGTLVSNSVRKLAAF